jgi:hypothetical protein
MSTLLEDLDGGEIKGIRRTLQGKHAYLRDMRGKIEAEWWNPANKVGVFTMTPSRRKTTPVGVIVTGDGHNHTGFSPNTRQPRMREATMYIENAKLLPRLRAYSPKGHGAPAPAIITGNTSPNTSCRTDHKEHPDSAWPRSRAVAIFKR